MKYYPILFIASLLLCIVFSCKDHTSILSSGEETIVKASLETSLSPISDFISAERHIPLETNDSCLLNGITRLQLEHDTIFLQSGNEIFTFAPDGNWLYYFMNQGVGEDEYATIDGMRVSGGIIYILDNTSHRIILYSKEGDFIRSIPLGYHYIDFFVPDARHIILASGNFNNSMHNFIWIDSTTGETNSTLAPYSISRTMIFEDYVPFSGTDSGGLVVNTPFCHTDFHLSKEAISPFVKFEFHPQEPLPGFSPENLNLETVSDFIHASGYSGVTHLGHYTSTDSCRYLSFMMRFGDKESLRAIGANYLMKFDGIGNDPAILLLNKAYVKSSFPYFSTMRYLDNGKLITAIDAEELLAIDSWLNLYYWKSQGLTEDSNPVVFIYTLK